MTSPAGPRLWVVDPSILQPEDECVRAILHGWPGPAAVFRPGLEPGAGPGPDDGHDVAAAVVMGSAVSVHDPHPWLARLAAWLLPIVRGEVRVPLLGICFGHQLIANLAGGRVGFVLPAHEKIVGVETTLADGGRLLPGRRRLRVVVSHREEVKRLPDGFRVAARRDRIEVDGMEHATLPLFSFQFHPEAGPEFAARAGIDPSALDERVRADSLAVLDAFRRFALSGPA